MYSPSKTPSEVYLLLLSSREIYILDTFTSHCNTGINALTVFENVYFNFSLRFFSDFKTHDFSRIFEMTIQKVVNSL